MPGKKRVSNGSDGKNPKQKRSQSNFEAKPEVAQAMVIYPFLNKALEAFDKKWEDFEDLEGILLNLWPDQEAQDGWARRLNELFPEEEGVQYLREDWGDHGLKNLRPYHWAWEKSAGNKGCVNREAYRHLLQSVLVKGFQTDVSIAGVELPLITPALDDCGRAAEVSKGNGNVE